jgi:ketosteroid isomerase-like protein
MNLNRRNIAIASAVALGVTGLVRSFAGRADAADETAVKAAVEALRKALLAADKESLEQLTADQLSYGHSDGRVQTKREFIDGVVRRKGTVISLTFPQLTVAVAADAAIARHVYAVDTEAATNGKSTTLKIGALEVWHKQDGNWKLLARQGFKPA